MQQEKEFSIKDFCDSIETFLSHFDSSVENIPRILPMRPYPPNCNPFAHDRNYKGDYVAGAWIGMHNSNVGTKEEHHLTEEEKLRQANGEIIYHEDPEYIVFVNQKTGQRFKLIFPID